MNIDGHEVERRYSGLVHIDGDDSGWNTVNDKPEFHEERARRYEKLAAECRLVAEFVRREAAERGAELDRRAALARDKWHEDDAPSFASWQRIAEHQREAWRNVVRALDADAARADE